MAFNTDQLFQAIDIILTERLQKVSFDTSLICTIVDNSNKDRNYYTVTDGNIKFDAYSDNVDYKVDDQVRVTVLNGDFGEKKYIEGRYLVDTALGAIDYVAPSETVLISSDQDIATTSFQLLANSSQKQVSLGTIIFSEEDKKKQQENLYNTLVVSANFETDLGELKSGNYGLQIDLLCQVEDGSTKRVKKIITFDSSEMFGNPYSFEIASHQEKRISLDGIGQINEIVLTGYQGFYIDDNGVEVISPFEDFNGELIFPKEIYISDLEIGFGADLISVDNRSLQIYTLSPSTYVYENPTSETNEKKIGIVWYNKTDNSEYIGFSDGIADLAYDEIDYINKSTADARLIAEKGQSGVATDEDSLRLSANLRESLPLMAEAANIITTSLFQVVNNLTNNLNAELGSLFTELVAESGDLNSSYVLASDATNDLEIMYGFVLNYGYQKQMGLNPQWDDSWTEVDFYSTFLQGVENAQVATLNAFASLDEQTKEGTQYQAYRETYTVYLARAQKELDKIDKYLNKISITSEDYNILKEYKTKTNYLPYAEQDLSGYDNKYCIYWYQWNEGFTQTNSAESFAGDDWQRIVEWDGFGLPLEEGENGYFPAKPETTPITYFLADNTSKEEKIKAILFFNHQMVESNILTFVNSEEVPDEEFIDEGDSLKIEHGSNSFDHYQLYSSSNSLLNNIDKSLERKLICSYEGRYLGNENLIGADIYWYVPSASTMLTFNKDYLLKQGFVSDIDFPTSHSRSGFVYFKKTIGNDFIEEVVLGPDGKPVLDENGDEEIVIVETSKESDRYFSYKVKDYFEQSAQNNTIEVYVYLKDSDKLLKGELVLTFSTFGTNGTKYTLSISPQSNIVAAVSDEENVESLELLATLRDAEGNKIPITDSLLGSDSEVEGYNLRTDWYSPTIDQYDLTTELAEDGSVTLRVAANYDPQENIDWVVGILKTTVNFNLPVVEDQIRIVDLVNLFPVPYARNKDYYISGPTSITYDNSGTISYMSGEPFRLYQRNIEGISRTDGLVEDQSWSLEYYNIRGERLEADSAILAYLPKLDNTNTLIAPNLYLQFTNDEAYYTFAVCKDSAGMVLWSHPIIITQNKYNSTVLNDWDGSFEIDEANGTILSTMVGAGRKTSNNTFEGILMGEVGAGANFNDNNYNGIGLYGFNDGAQSFAFGIDGTGFIGKAGRGRIEFDGNNSRIYNSSYQTEGRGMLIDLDDGLIDMTGQSGTGVNVHLDTISPYFYIDSATDKRLMNIADDEYYLQSENYQPGSFNASDAALNTVGAGTHFDLQTGLLDAYDLKILTKNVLIDSSATADPFFVVKDNDGCNLFYAGIDNYYLKSHGYSDTDLRGMKIDLTSGLINAYNFSLTGNAGSGNYAGSYLKITSTPSLTLHLKDSTNSYNLDLLKIDTSNFVMNSANWGSNKGMQIDVGKGFIKMYREGSSDNAILIDSTVSTSGFPFQIGKVVGERRAFNIKWDGTIEGGASNRTWKITSGGDATFDYLIANGGKIGDITINKGNLSGTGWTLSSDSLTIKSGGSINLGSETGGGTLTAGSTTIQPNGTVTVGGNLYVNGDAGIIVNNGSVNIKKGTLTVEDVTYLNGSVFIDGTSLASYIRSTARASEENTGTGTAGYYMLMQASSGGTLYRWMSHPVSWIINTLDKVNKYHG